MRITVSHRSIVWSALIAGLFSGAVALALIVSLVGGQTSLAMDAPEYVELTERLKTAGDDQELRERIRALDTQLRRDYFRRLAFVRRGAWLLLGGLAVTALLAQGAATVRRRLPQPKPPTTAGVGPTRTASRTRYAVSALMCALAAAVLASRLIAPSILPRDVAELDSTADLALPVTMASQGNSVDPQIDAASIAARPPADYISPSSNAIQNGNSEPPAVESITPELSDASASTTAGIDTEPPPSAAQLAANWPRFRGPHGAGVSAFTDVPEHWDAAAGEGVRWKSPVALPGVSSPIVWDDRVFLSGANAEQREVYCYATDGGELLWQSSVSTTPKDPTQFKVNEMTGYAASTPATDGRRVYAMFANGDLAAYDFSGREVWKRDLGIPDNPYGHATSLTTFRNLLLVQLDQGTVKDNKSQLLALHSSTGEIAWQVARAVPASWASPIVVEHGGRPLLVTCADPWTIAYDPESGEEIWRADVLHGDVGPSPVYGNGLIYVAADYAVVAAIDAGGRGDVTQSHVRWTADFGLPDICSPLLAQGRLLMVASYNALVCYDGEAGGVEPRWESDLDSVSVASPSLVGDRVYVIGEEGRGWVLKPNAAGCELVAENNLGERCFSSPAFQPGRIYVRGENHLFCLGRPE